MALPRSPRIPTNDQDVANPKLPDNREATKSPVNPMDISTLAKRNQSSLSLLEQAYGVLDKDGA